MRVCSKTRLPFYLKMSAVASSLQYMPRHTCSELRVYSHTFYTIGERRDIAIFGIPVEIGGKGLRLFKYVSGLLKIAHSNPAAEPL